MVNQRPAGEQARADKRTICTWADTQTTGGVAKEAKRHRNVRTIGQRFVRSDMEIENERPASAQKRKKKYNASINTYMQYCTGY